MRILKSPIIIGCLCICNAVPANAQEPQIKKVYSNTTNYPILAVAQDKLGYIWFSSAQSGISRYDGTELKTMLSSSTDTNSLASNYVESMLFDRENILWIGCYGAGLDRYDMVRNKFNHYRHDEHDNYSISSDTVTSILEDRSGNLWIGTYRGLNLLDRKTGKFVRYMNQPADSTSLSYNHVKSLYEDKRGTLWIGTGSAFQDVGETDADGGLNKFDQKTGKFTRYKRKANDVTTLSNNKVRALFEDSKGNFWVGTAGDGLHIMDRATGKFRRFPYDPKNPQQLSRPPIISVNSIDHILFITEDPVGDIWISTLNGGINRYDPRTGKVDLYGMSAPLNSNKLVSLDPKKRLDDIGFWQAFRAADNSLWFPSYGGNIYNLNYNYTTIPFYNDAGRDGNTFYVDSASENLWVGTNEGLMQKTFDGQFIKIFRHDPRNPESICNDTVASMRADKNGRLWLASSAGVSCFDPSSGLSTNYLNKVNDPTSVKGIVIGNLAFDKNDELWVGSNTMLECLDKERKRFRHYVHSAEDTNSICSSNIYAIFPDKTTGNIWVATTKGLDRLNPSTGRFTHFLRKNFCTSVFIDHEGVTWAGSESSLYRMKQGESSFSVFEYPFSNSRSNDGVLHIMEDDSNNLWAATKYSLFQINSNRETMRRFGAIDGIPENAFSYCDNYKAPDGKLYFGDQNGYYAFYPAELPPNPPPPVITFTNFMLKEQNIIPGESTVLPAPVWETKEINLSYNQNVFSIDFISVNYRSVKPNHYFFRLENYDNDWHSLENEHKAFFFNVPPGNYIFHARVVTEDGSMNEKTMRITIAPPWWKTKWAYAVYILTFLFLAFMANRFIRSRILEKERARNREKELEQAKQIEKAYTELKATQAQLIQSEKMASLGQLTAGIAHEIQNPLNFVNNFSEINNELIEEFKVQKANLKAEAQDEFLNDIFQNNEKIIHHGKRAESIVKGMLQHSRTSTGQKELTDINKLAEEYLRLSYHGIRARDKSFNAAIETNLDPAVGNINIAAQDISRVLLNLYNNAFDAINEQIKAGMPGSAPLITVQSRRIDGKVEIQITDNGIGIPADIIDKIFQPFFTTKPTGRGTGLGLSVSYDIVKAHDGTLNVESVVGKGSIFTLRLPA